MFSSTGYVSYEDQDLLIKPDPRSNTNVLVLDADEETQHSPADSRVDIPDKVYRFVSLAQRSLNVSTLPEQVNVVPVMSNINVFFH